MKPSTFILIVALLASLPGYVVFNLLSNASFFGALAMGIFSSIAIFCKVIDWLADL